MSEEEHRPLPPPQIGLSALFSPGLIAAGVLLGIMLIWVGHLVVASAVPSGDALTQARKTYVILSGLGGLLSSGALLGGGILNKDIDKFVRLGMIIAGGLIIVQMLGLVSTSSII